MALAIVVREMKAVSRRGQQLRRRCYKGRKVLRVGKQTIQARATRSLDQQDSFGRPLSNKANRVSLWAKYRLAAIFYS